MWETISNWSWITKVLVAALLLSPFTTCVTFFNRHYGMRGDVFLLGWMVGSIFALTFFIRNSGETGTNFLATPFLMTIALGLLVGGGANLLYAQSIPAAPNPGLPLAVFTISIPIAYTLSYGISKIVPQQLPGVEFSWINFSGIIVLILGLLLVTHKTS